MISAMVAPFAVELGMVEMVQRIGQSAAEVEAARVLGVGRQPLFTLKNVVVAVNTPPASPCGLASRKAREQFSVRRNAAPIETYAKNSVCTKFAEMAGRVNDAVQTYRLHMCAGVVQALTLAHGGFSVQVVVHVFGIHAEQAAEVHAASEHSLESVPDKRGNLSAAHATPGASGKVDTIEIRLCRSRCDEPAKGK